MFRYNVLMHASSVQLMAATCIWRLFISLYMATIFGSISANIRRNVQVHNSHITMIMAATKSSHFIDDGNRVLCALHNVGLLSVSHPHNFTISAINFDLFISKRPDELTGSNNLKADG